MGGMNSPGEYAEENEISPERLVLKKIIQRLEKELGTAQIAIPAEATKSANLLQEGEKQKELYEKMADIGLAFANMRDKLEEGVISTKIQLLEHLFKIDTLLKINRKDEAESELNDAMDIAEFGLKDESLLNDLLDIADRLYPRQ